MLMVNRPQFTCIFTMRMLFPARLIGYAFVNDAYVRAHLAQVTCHMHQSPSHIKTLISSRLSSAHYDCLLLKNMAASDYRQSFDKLSAQFGTEQRAPYRRLHTNITPMPPHSQTATEGAPRSRRSAVTVTRLP